MKYEMMQGSHGRPEKGKNVIYHPGDPIEIRGPVPAALVDRVRPWPYDDAKAAADDSDAIEDANDIAKLSISRVKQLMAGISDRLLLAALYAAEQDGQNRKGALRVIRLRLGELEA